jgi:hypothetical protein
MSGEETMETKKTLVCTCENCGNEAEMTIKCEEVAVETTPAEPTAKPKSGKHTFVCTQCGNEADMIVDL